MEESKLLDNINCTFPSTIIGLQEIGIIEDQDDFPSTEFDDFMDETMLDNVDRVVNEHVNVDNTFDNEGTQVQVYGTQLLV